MSYGAIVLGQGGIQEFGRASLLLTELKCVDLSRASMQRSASTANLTFRGAVPKTQSASRAGGQPTTKTGGPRSAPAAKSLPTSMGQNATPLSESHYGNQASHSITVVLKWSVPGYSWMTSECPRVQRRKTASGQGAFQAVRGANLSRRNAKCPGPRQLIGRARVRRLPVEKARERTTKNAARRGRYLATSI